MRLGYFTMPLHPAHRPPAQTLQEDREAIILADRLGYYDAFVGEHLTEKSENVTNSFIFLATLISDTKTIKLATGTSNLSHTHPTLIAAHAAMFDHLAQGRFIFGVSPGALLSDAEALGLINEDRNRIFAEAIDVILQIWERDPPYAIDLPGNRFKVTTEKTHVAEIGKGVMYKPYQKPRPEIVGTVVAPFSKGVTEAAFREFPAAALGPESLGELRRGQASRRADRRPRRLAHRAHDLRRRRRQGRRALRQDRCEQPVPLLLAATAHQVNHPQAPHRVQDARKPGRRRVDR